MIDIGVNLTSSKFSGDRAAVVERARSAGVETLIITGTSVRASREAIAMAEEFGLFATAGVHPHDAKTWGAETRNEVLDLCAEERVVAVGECGLDFDRNFSAPDDQRNAFAEQLQIGKIVKKPLFLHERSAHEALVEILEPCRSDLDEIVVHCFTGSRAELRRYLDLDIHIGITGWICDERRGTDLFGMVGDIPANRLMIESDAPWLLPRSLRPRPKGGRNEPAFLTEVRNRVAIACKKDPETVARETSETARRFFRI